MSLVLTRALPDLRGSLLLLVVAAVTATLFVGGGTGSTATFTAQTTNADNAFGLGTLVLGTTRTSGTACLSSAPGGVDANDNRACDALFSASAPLKPGDSASATLSVQNLGSVDATTLRLFASAPCVDADDAGAFHGTGSPCAKALLSIQECGSAGCADAASATCWYGGATGTTAGCTDSDAAKTLDAFRSNFAAASTGLALDGGLEAGTARHFKIGLKVPNGGPGADNALMGRKATFDLTWYIEQ